MEEGKLWRDDTMMYLDDGADSRWSREDDETDEDDDTKDEIKYWEGVKWDDHIRKERGTKSDARVHEEE